MAFCFGCIPAAQMRYAHQSLESLQFEADGDQSANPVAASYFHTLYSGLPAFLYTQRAGFLDNSYL